MCVVLICPPKQRPDLTILRACHAANPHGAGVAWRDKRRIHWRKALTPGEVNHLIQKVPGEVIIHFRWASVGGVEPLLCHPFPVTAEAALGYEGLCKSVLFHNGTWGNWEAAQEIIGDLDGPMSDSRAVAALVHHKGTQAAQKAARPVGGDGQPRRSSCSATGSRGAACSSATPASRPTSPRARDGHHFRAITPHSADAAPQTEHSGPHGSAPAGARQSPTLTRIQ